MQFVAEVASNHNQNLQRCLDFVDAAARLGCDAVKFQLFDIDELFASEVLQHSAEHRARRRWQLPRDYLPSIRERCRHAGIRLGCTPFDLDGVVFLADFVDFFKIASYELLWLELIEACARTGKPVVLSAGMATLEEVTKAVDAVRLTGNTAVTVLHCVSVYPARPEECNLKVISTLRRQLGCAAGWSDHSRDPAVLRRAIHRWQADMIEFHFDLDETGSEHGPGHCWLPGEIGPLIAEARLAGQIDGSGEKVPVDREQNERRWRADPGDGKRPLRAERARFSRRQSGFSVSGRRGGGA